MSTHTHTVAKHTYQIIQNRNATGTRHVRIGVPSHPIATSQKRLNAWNFLIALHLEELQQQKKPRKYPIFFVYNMDCLCIFDGFELCECVAKSNIWNLIGSQSKIHTIRSRCACFVTMYQNPITITSFLFCLLPLSEYKSEWYWVIFLLAALCDDGVATLE